jgi:hypothetical protein
MVQEGNKRLARVRYLRLGFGRHVTGKYDVIPRIGINHLKSKERKFKSRCSTFAYGLDAILQPQ